MWCDKSGEHKDPKKAFVARLEERGFERKRETAGVNKGRYIWLGIGFRSGDDPPEDGDFGSPGEPSSSQGSPEGFGRDKPNTSGPIALGEPSEAENQHSPKQYPHVEKDSDSGFTGFTGFTPEQEPSPPEDEEPFCSKLPPGISATIEQLRHIEELERQGYGKRGARIEVLAKDHPLGCECEVCS
jgi:hypothetical protein